MKYLNVAGQGRLEERVLSVLRRGAFDVLLLSPGFGLLGGGLYGGAVLGDGWTGLFGFGGLGFGEEFLGFEGGDAAGAYYY